MSVPFGTLSHPLAERADYSKCRIQKVKLGSRIKQIKPGLAKEKALDEFIRQGQAEEVEMVKRLSPFIQASPRKMWALSLVTKQDLWYPNRSEVESHYQTGEYAMEMERIVVAKGGQEFRHDVHFCSLVISNWVSSAKETLRKCVEGQGPRI